MASERVREGEGMVAHGFFCRSIMTSSPRDPWSTECIPLGVARPSMRACTSALHAVWRQPQEEPSETSGRDTALTRSVCGGYQASTS